MPGLALTVEILERADALARSLAPAPGTGAPDALGALTGRAALLGLYSRGPVSAGGGTHLMRTADGWSALTLSRPDDVEAVPALLECDRVGTDPWPALHRWAATRPAAAVTGRAALLGLPAATLGEAAPDEPLITGCGPRGQPRTVAGLLVVDLTSMWAGPWCAQLLHRAGATVVKVESPSRPDGTRAGEPSFFDWMNSGKLCYGVDFDRDRDDLAALLSVADVVLEGSRPAALHRRGLGPCDVAARPGRVWTRITGHGTVGDNAGRVAFGDDAAVAGGLVGHDDTGCVFLGDAIADPLTGMAAAEAVVDSLGRGGGELIEMSMAAVAAGYAAGPATPIEVDPVPPDTGAVPAGALGSANPVVHRLVAERRGAPC
ncbi:CoA transferase [Mycolicibacterium palauense]|uniref:CoA transferase n=1 Tax=Mycolicibacterium palauense TaxID=2034511 RepID=UPI000BFEF9C1|nr:CoA transferase [Mycolicibacterium palauense]